MTAPDSPSLVTQMVLAEKHGLWRMPRPRRERGDQFEEHGREFRGFSLWRGRLWLCSQERGETGLDEAGSKQHT